MHGVLYQYLSSDHDRLDALLTKALATPGVIEPEYYSEFRKGLLRHISIEEKIVLPAIARLQQGRKAAIADRLRLDHSAIASLLVPPPNPSIILTLQSILAVHNPLEEQEGGLYELFETLAKPHAEALLAQMETAPPVAVAPYNHQSNALEVTKQVVLRAGYEFKTA
jgi:hypothetical protein